MDIACLPEDIREGITTHQELDPANMLSLIASLTPFSDYNQSPRNMYVVTLNALSDQFFFSVLYLFSLECYRHDDV